MEFVHVRDTVFTRCRLLRFLSRFSFMILRPNRFWFGCLGDHRQYNGLKARTRRLFPDTWPLTRDQNAAASSAAAFSSSVLLVARLAPHVTLALVLLPQLKLLALCSSRLGVLFCSSRSSSHFVPVKVHAIRLLMLPGLFRSFLLVIGGTTWGRCYS